MPAGDMHQTRKVQASLTLTLAAIAAAAVAVIMAAAAAFSIELGDLFVRPSSISVPYGQHAVGLVHPAWAQGCRDDPHDQGHRAPRGGHVWRNGYIWR